MYLTTTRLDRFWGDDEEILILGDWCEIESFTAAEKKRSKTLRYHWSNYNKKVIDAYRIYDSYEKILKSIALYMNRIHQIEESQRYWEILVGPWLQNFMEIVFDRYSCLKNAEITKDLRVVFPFENRIPETFRDFLNEVPKDRFNWSLMKSISVNGQIKIDIESRKSEIIEKEIEKKPVSSQKKNRN